MPCGVPDSDDMDAYHLEETIKKLNRKLSTINEVDEKTTKLLIDEIKNLSNRNVELIQMLCEITKLLELNKVEFSAFMPVHIIDWIEAHKKEDAAKEA